MLFRFKSISLLFALGSSKSLTSSAFVTNCRSKLVPRALSQQSFQTFGTISARYSGLCHHTSTLNLRRFVSTSLLASESLATADTNSGESQSTNVEPEQYFTAYVVNLSYSTTLQQIHSLFSQHAPVVKVYMPFDKQDTQKSKGFAFVSFASKEELDRVIGAVHESQVDGRTIFVTEAKPRSPKSSSDTNNSSEIGKSSDAPSRKQSKDSSTKLYVGNISYDTTTDDLIDLFAPYGKVIDTYLPVDNATGTPRGFAFVTVTSDDVDSAIRDLDGIEFFGRSIVVNKPLPRGQKAVRPAKTSFNSNQGSARQNSDYSNTVKLYVGNLSFDTTEDDIRSLFERFGELNDVYVPMDQGTGRRRGFAFVTLGAEDAPTAIEETDGLEVDGRVLRVNAAQPKGYNKKLRESL